MTNEELDAIANREAHCKPFGAAVTLSVGERDALVAMARDGLRYQWWRNHAWFFRAQKCLQPAWPRYGEIPVPRGMLKSDAIDAAVDAAMAEEQA
ncbi:hypothetical protein [Achromobacter marplatensis]|jgi:hypothetical protein|uniref:hypothetical protein n=1 Tax=Achromobacter marplatensis TaxID=470868 RepID=UPI000277F493|nr:hypothetical protein [Achromobacter marplatensis]EJO27585.1 hypothetical protein QWC_31091 [Achromobacter marplatensis]